MSCPSRLTLAAVVALSVPLETSITAWAHGDVEHPSKETMIEAMRDAHAGHDHEHDFEAMEHVSEEDMHQAMDLMMDIGLALPPMDSERGRDLFLNKGCVVCHAVNGVGGEIGPDLDAADMPKPMNAFEFAARMWRGAPAMAQMQEDLLGEMINLTGQELADLIAFAHDGEEQSEVTAEQIPPKFQKLLK